MIWEDPIELSLKPLTLLFGATVHVNFVPVGTILFPAFEKITSKLEPLQTSWLIFEIPGRGFTLTFKLKGSPEQLFITGVTT